MSLMFKLNFVFFFHDLEFISFPRDSIFFVVQGIMVVFKEQQESFTGQYPTHQFECCPTSMLSTKRVPRRESSFKIAARLTTTTSSLVCSVSSDITGDVE